MDKNKSKIFESEVDSNSSDSSSDRSFCKINNDDSITEM